MKKILTTSTLILIILLLFFSGCQQQKKIENNNINREPTTLYVGYSNSSYYQTIQEALNNSIDGDRIIIESGTYNELLTINKSISLSGEDKNTTLIQPLIKDKNSQVTIITIDADYCKIENVGITIAKNSNFANGIFLNSSNNTIYNTIINGVDEAISFSGSSANNIISTNMMMNNQYGIRTIGSKNNTISNNIFSSNTLYGVFLFADSDNNIISNNSFSDNNWGIRFKGSSYNEVFQNCIIDNHQGVYCCCGANENEFYSNIFKNNLYFDAKEDANLVNFWYNYQTSIGNYWDKYTGTDENTDGFGDTPFVIPDAKHTDLYPLINPPADILCK